MFVACQEPGPGNEGNHGVWSLYGRMSLLYRPSRLLYPRCASSSSSAIEDSYLATWGNVVDVVVIAMRKHWTIFVGNSLVHDMNEAKGLGYCMVEVCCCLVRVLL